MRRLVDGLHAAAVADVAAAVVLRIGVEQLLIEAFLWHAHAMRVPRDRREVQQQSEPDDDHADQRRDVDAIEEGGVPKAYGVVANTDYVASHAEHFAFFNNELSADAIFRTIALGIASDEKRGFGLGKWNGVGGKPEPGETWEAPS